MQMDIALIIDLQKQLIENHEQLLAISKEKTQAIIQNDVSALNGIIRAESKLIKQIGETESRRMLESSKLMANASRRAFLRKVTLKELITIVYDAENRVVLQKQHARLYDLLQELKGVTGHNQQLIQQSLDFIRFSIDIMVSPVDESMTYRHPQHLAGNAPRFGVFNSKV